ncbi:SET methyltransferase domain containing protein [Nitzschia inconspicua]|uniref:SET methyltransferase domain containing protein n=1 Tax=Nitzschia inconspicua TaxID=303405 RepID=A0A9K3L7B5_9STRA|nr:SET methyltransferase domain containing protein [Nitzschia inconspicua]
MDSSATLSDAAIQQPLSDAANGAASPSAPSKETDKVLRRGDLARILGRKDKKLRDHHQGDLGRVVRSIPKSECDKIFDDKDDYDPHPFVYDIELVLGGKLMAVRRSELQYTTAFEEGMTGEFRQKRDRKPKEDVSDILAESTRKGTAKKQKKTTGKTANTQAGKKRGASGNNTKGSKTKKQKGSLSTPEQLLLPSNSNNGLDMFERHRREFERSLSRLEKADVYGYFTSLDIPPEYDECYDTPTSQTNDSNALTHFAPQNPPNSSDIPLESSQILQPPTLSVHSNTSADTSSIVTHDSTPEKPLHQLSNNFIGSSSMDGPPFNFAILRKRLEHGRYILDREHFEIEQRIKLLTPYYKSIGKKIPSGRKKLPNFWVHHKKGIDWDLFRDDVIGMCDAAVHRHGAFATDSGSGTVKGGAKKIKELMDQIYDKIAKKQHLEMEISNDSYRYTAAINASPNTEAAMQGKRWRREAFPERKYEKLRNDVVCAGLSELDERIAAYELKTSLSDSFVGLAYTYNDNGQSEGWMKAMLNDAHISNEQQSAAIALSSDEGVIKAQVAASMETLLMAVQDRVMTEKGVLEQPELKSANWECKTDDASEKSAVAEIIEQPVWGMDCYTRRNVAICLETEFDADTVHSFVEKWLLPAINACPVDLAYNLSNAALILEGLPFDMSSSLDQDAGTTMEEWRGTLLGKALIKKIDESSPSWLKAAAHVLRRAITSLGQDFFRVHPKGHGSIVLCPKIEPNRLVTYYRGEVYPSWRWGEKMDAISVIQQKKGLKPRLPDFYNMALERPQSDPRGYGLLFVDASRKSGYGSMLSHSCNPSCEVKVVALNGELTLAMTTLREMTIGEEVTFDYNAATDSLHEYQAAVCLCGNVQCRGSFLHFAMADCYQQVLNRNSPIAVLLSQLIKGCTKQVMAEDDDKILKRHGFQSAVFGAISVNRRIVNSAETTNMPLDSMEIVPIWLRTFVADTLRYIEYERRALPIALLCNEITKDNEKEKKKKDSSEPEATKKPVLPKKGSSGLKKGTQCATKPVFEKPIKGHKPEPTFFFFSKRRREYFQSKLLLLSSENANLTGLALESELKRLASAEWKTLGIEEKEKWKALAYDEWKKNGGEEKARLEAERLSRLDKGKVSTSESLETKVRRTVKSSIEERHVAEPADRITFQAADAEGIRAMEQRIQQLTQSLSRVGRVLDRHREVKLRQQEDLASNEEIFSPALLRGLAHSPLSIMPDEHVIAWMWNHENGIVRTLLRMAQDEICVSPDMYMALRLTESKFSELANFGSPWEEGDEGLDPVISPSEGRKILNDALMEFRTKLLEGMDKMATDIKSKKASAREIEKRRSQQAKTISRITTPCDQSKIRLAVKFVLNELVDTVEEKFKAELGSHETPETPKSNPETLEITEPWLLNYNKRFKIEKAADLLLLYASTSTFFRLVPYEALKSSPIEVYARELGNEVPLSIVDRDQEMVTPGMRSSDNSHDKGEVVIGVNADDMSESSMPSTQENGTRGKVSGLCDPEDIISEVVVGYQGEYVLSQLLQWYNAGLEQKPGIPDMLGCCILPSMTGCWSIDATKVANSSTDKSTSYRVKIRPRLVEWLKDPYKRGSPWPDELRRQHHATELHPRP